MVTLNLPRNGLWVTKLRICPLSLLEEREGVGRGEWGRGSEVEWGEKERGGRAEGGAEEGGAEKEGGGGGGSGRRQTQRELELGNFILQGS